MKKYLVMALTLVCLTLSGCTDAERAGLFANGQKHHIKQYSGGSVVGEWDSTGKVVNEANSDGYYFEDAKTGKLTMVSGTVQITVE